MILTGQGAIFMGTYNPTGGLAASGYLTGVTKIGCANSEFSTSFSRSTKKIKETCSGSKNDFAEIETEKSAEVTLTMIDVDKKTLAAALSGTLTSVTGSTVTNEIFPTVAVGENVSLKYTDVSAVVLTDSAGTPATLTLGTHYEITSAEHGIIKILSLGTLVQPFKAAYTYAAQGNITAFTAASVERGLLYQGINTQDGKKYKLVIPRIAFGLDGAINWISSEESPVTLKGSMLYVPEYANDLVQGPFMRMAGGMLV